MAVNKKQLTKRDKRINNNAIQSIIDTGQRLVINDIGEIYGEIMNMRDPRDKVNAYLKFSKFFFVELPQVIGEESDEERFKRETMEITDKFSEDKIEDAEVV